MRYRRVFAKEELILHSSLGSTIGRVGLIGGAKTWRKGVFLKKKGGLKSAGNEIGLIGG